MKLHYFPPRIEQRGHLLHFFLEIIDIRLALAVVEGNDCGAATKPAERLAERDMKIEREVAFAAIVLEDSLGEVRPCQGIGKLRGRGIRRVAWPGDVIFLDQIKIDFEHAHLAPLTVSTSA